MQNPTSNRTILTVAELNAEVNQLLTQGFPLLWVEGEISNLVRPASGHLYFSLKDNKSQIRSAMFRNRNMKLSIKPENGMKVLVRGRVGLYEPRGEFQLIAEHMEDAGVGQLQRQFEALKQKLSQAGLFDEAHKKELPEYPKRIAIITSPSGAAIRDILHVLERRSPHTPVLIYPVSVQGEKAKLEIETAIRKANSDKKCDVIILARGGGSIEDLWAFNEENVAGAIYHSEIPIISGIGHEIDFTIADFVADLRAPTPSAAAELITADSAQLLTDVMQTELWLQQTIKQNMKQRVQALDWLTRRLKLQKPSLRIEQQLQRVDELENRLHSHMQNKINDKQRQLVYLRNHLVTLQPDQLIQQKKQTLSSLTNTLTQSIKALIEQKKGGLQLNMAILDSTSPLKTLDRGYAIVKNSGSNKIITSINQMRDNMQISVALKDGEAIATIDAIDVANKQLPKKNSDKFH